MQIAQTSALPGSFVATDRRSSLALSPFQLCCKRAFDLLLAVPLFLLSLPLGCIICLAIHIGSHGPALYKQTRVGFRCRCFTLLKFRSMIPSTNSTHRAYVARWISDGAYARAASGQFKLSHDPRITRLGAILRRYSLDELPQLWNVLRGEMSLVGPRPPLAYELEHYHTWQLYRLNTPPGITGLWQVSGRNRLSFDEMIALDLEYIENWSLRRDLNIVLRTFRAVFAGNGN